MYTEKKGVKNGRQHIFNSLWCSTGMQLQRGSDDCGGTVRLGDPGDPHPGPTGATPGMEAMPAAQPAHTDGGGVAQGVVL